MNLGAFSVSLSVKDLEVSKVFYTKLGFEVTGGDTGQGYLILKNGTTVIGLFQGMFEKNTLTFNPGWDNNADKLKSFTDVRDLQKGLKAKGVKIDMETDESAKGPAHIIIHDPDGNPILIDQHV